MIAKSDYVWVDGLDDILINGEIMPLRRDGAYGTANKRCLRGEDIAWLYEYLAEVTYMSRQYQGVGVHHFEKRLEGAQIRYLYFLERSLVYDGVHYFFFNCDPVSHLIEKLVSNSDYPFDHWYIEKFFPDLMTTAIPEIYESRNDPLSLEPRKKLFDNIQLLRYCVLTYWGRGTRPWMEYPNFEQSDYTITGTPGTIILGSDQRIFSHRKDFDYSYGGKFYTTAILKDRSPSPFSIQYAAEEKNVYCTISVIEVLNGTRRGWHYFCKVTQDDWGVHNDFSWNAVKSRVYEFLDKSGITLLGLDDEGRQYVDVYVNTVFAVLRPRPRFDW